MTVQTDGHIMTQLVIQRLGQMQVGIEEVVCFFLQLITGDRAGRGLCIGEAVFGQHLPVTDGGAGMVSQTQVCAVTCTVCGMGRCLQAKCLCGLIVDDIIAHCSKASAQIGLDIGCKDALIGHDLNGLLYA